MVGRRSRLPPAQEKLLRRTLGAAHPARDWLPRVLSGNGRDRRLTRELVAAARGEGGASWTDRLLAALLLEHAAWRLPPEDADARGELFDGLGLLTAGGSRLRDSVLGDGFSTTEPDGFAREFARLLTRNEALHRALERQPRSAAALRRLLELTRQECRVLLARYLITPREVVDEFLSRVRRSDGLESPFLALNPLAAREAESARAGLPEFEAEILRLLLEQDGVYWPRLDPALTLNAMVELPLTTVAMVFKPPGSQVEFEFKRSGHPTEQPLRITFGSSVPAHHRLDGGGYGLALEWEVAAAAHLASAYRTAHGEELAMCRPVSVLSVSTVPSGDTPIDILTYFTDPRVFGPDYGEMRSCLRRSLQSFARSGRVLGELETELDLTYEFLIQVKPVQAILVDSSSFRVDKVAAYLTGEGAAGYFRAALGRQPGRVEARLFADTVFGEALGRYRPPTARPARFDDYVEAALRVPENRERATEVYLGTMRQAGRFWGTLLAWGASSRGESTVARNVGLRSVWRQGRWATSLVFMDHDQLDFYTPPAKHFSTSRTLPAMELDARYLVGARPGRMATESLLNLLDQIYRADPALRTRGRRTFRRALRAAYVKTRRRQRRGDLPPGLPGRAFVDSLDDWHQLVAHYLAARKRGLKQPLRSARRWLRRKGYRGRRLTDRVRALDRHTEFLRRYGFVFTADI